MVNERMYGLGARRARFASCSRTGWRARRRSAATACSTSASGTPASHARRREAGRARAYGGRSLRAARLLAGGWRPPRAPAVADHIHRRFDVPASPDQVYLTAGAAAGWPSPSRPSRSRATRSSSSRRSSPSTRCGCSRPPAARAWRCRRMCPTSSLTSTRWTRPSGPRRAPSSSTRRTTRWAPCTHARTWRPSPPCWRKEADLGRKIYVISDEPYREITYGAEVPYVPCVWPRTIVCYSYSKSFPCRASVSAISTCPTSWTMRAVSTAVAGAGRALGFICAPVLFQRVIAPVSTSRATSRPRREPPPAYRGPGGARLRCRGPDGAFYLWVRALEDDAQAFSNRAKAHELLLVPSDSFGVGGWVRVSYCVTHETIENSVRVQGAHGGVPRIGCGPRFCGTRRAPPPFRGFPVKRGRGGACMRRAACPATFSRSDCAMAY